MSCREGCSLWSRGSWLGGSLVSALSFVAFCTLQVAHGVFVAFSLLSCIMGLRNMTHKLSSACAEMITSYHLSSQQICFTHKLEPVTSRFCGLVVVFLLCGFLFVVWVCFGVFVLLWFFVFRFWVSVFEPWNVTSLWTMYRSFSSLLLRPLQHRPCVT